MPKYSRERNASLMLRHLSDIISFKLNDPSIGFVTINEVEITSDYSYAKIYVSFYGDGDVNVKIATLNNASGFMRHELATRMTIRKIPELRFIYDDTLEKAHKIEQLLRNSKK